jgi:hypothetical protein
VQILVTNLERLYAEKGENYTSETLEMCINRRQSEGHLGTHNYEGRAAVGWLYRHKQWRLVLCCEALLLRRKLMIWQPDSTDSAQWHSVPCQLGLSTVITTAINMVRMTGEGREGRQISTNLELCIERISAGYQSG